MRMKITAVLLGANLTGPAGAQTSPPAAPGAGQAMPQPARQAGARTTRNVVLFVADGLRPGMVNETTAPAMADLLRRGVRFTNTHSLFPTFTTANASALATGHYLGDTGDFSNVEYTGYPVPGAGQSLTPFLESDPVLGDIDDHFAGDYLNEETILKAARDAGFSIAAIGKLGPTLIQDHTERSGQHTIVVDDLTGRPGGIALAAEVAHRLADAGLRAEAPGRSENAHAGTATVPGTTTANIGQQDWFTAVATKAVLPLFVARGQPFVLVFWSRDPDGTQHNEGDSLGRLIPGINGPTSLAAIRNADTDLAEIETALRALGLDKTTDIVLTSDHGFSTISKESATSFAATQRYPGVPEHQLPPGFLAIDLAHALGERLFDPDARNAPVGPNARPSRDNGVIGSDPAHPDVIVAANGGSDLIYLPKHDHALAARIARALSAEDYTSGLFVDDSLEPIAGAVALSSIGLHGSAVMPTPSLVVNFRSFALGCDDPTICGVEVADTPLQQGQGMHGSFSRADTRNIMGALGPDFRGRFEDPAPASTADLGKTIAAVLGLDIPAKGKLLGRVLTEAMPNGEAPPHVISGLIHAQADALGHVTAVQYQEIGKTRYFDAAGYPGRTLGLNTERMHTPSGAP